MQWPSPARDHIARSHQAGGMSSRITHVARRQLIWLTGLLVFVSGLGLGASLLVLRNAALRSGEMLNESFARVIEEQTSRTFQTADQRLELASTRLKALEAAGILTEESAHEMLREQLQGLPFMRAMWVVDATGHLIYNSNIGDRGTPAMDREYFRIYQQKPQTGFHIGAPVLSRTTGLWLISASRPLRDPQGRVAGVIVAALDPSYFDSLWRQIQLGTDSAVGMFRRDGVLMMRSPRDDAGMGKSFESNELFTRRLPGSASGTYPLVSAFDGRPRVASYRALSTYPDLVVNIGRGYGEILGPWTRFAVLSGSVWLAAAVLVGLLATMLYRQIVRSERTELQFSRLAQAMPQIVFITDANGQLIFLSEQWSEITGVPTEVGLSKGWLNWVHPEDHGWALDMVRKTLATGENSPSEHRMLQKDGSYRWQLARAVPNRDAAGRIVSWYGTSTDIDDLKQANATLKQQAELVRMAGRLSRLGGWAVEIPSMRFIWSDEATEILQLKPGDAPTLEEAIAMCVPESRELATKAVQDCLIEGAPFDVEARMLTPSGVDIIVRSVGHAVRDEQGNIVGAQGALQDVTALVTAEHDIRAYLVTLQRAAEAAQAITQQRSLDAMLQEVADQARSVIGARRAIVSLSRNGEAAPVIAESAGLAAARAPASREWLTALLKSREGSEIGQLRLSGKYDGEFNRHDRLVVNELAQLASIAIDNVNLLAQVTDLNTGLEERIARRTAQLQRSNAELEAFSYSVSHDLRSPLSAMDGFSRLLQRELVGQSGERAQHYLDRIRAGAGQMGHLIDGLLSLAHISRVEMRQDEVDLSQIASEILERLQADAPARHVAFSVEPGLQVRGDSRLLRSVMENLLGNAWKFSARVELAEIAVGFSAQHQAFFVRDNGAGFDMAYAAKLFGTFQRLHDAAEFPGTGVGLATVARIVARHGGRIWAESSPGRGATFHFTLPGG
jgi:PAS domain S-box-containing protein